MIHQANDDRHMDSKIHKMEEMRPRYCFGSNKIERTCVVLGVVIEADGTLYKDGWR